MPIIPGLPGSYTQEEIDLIKAYEPPKEELHLFISKGDWAFSENGQYLILRGAMLAAAKNNIVFNYNNKNEEN